MFEIKLESIEEVNIVLSGLAELPLKVSLQLLQKIQGQVQNTLKEQEAAKAAASKADPATEVQS